MVDAEDYDILGGRLFSQFLISYVGVHEEEDNTVETSTVRLHSFDFTSKVRLHLCKVNFFPTRLGHFFIKYVIFLHIHLLRILRQHRGIRKVGYFVGVRIDI